ncbi:hypothetical protein [Streptomyces salinarius]|uniref:hypothetical protein n=1 Tax=Streptomyces salinarius TaxID=2762598 RepID=UPI0016480EBD|nr:hypothetical protein [Streptomyces salinarius]
MTAFLPLLARVPLLVWAVLAVVSLYLLLIVFLSLTAVYGRRPARRRAAAEMARVLWFTASGDGDQAPDGDRRA